MKTSLIAASILLGSAGSAFAADPQQASGKESTPFEWAGSYLGIQLGYGWGTSNFTDKEYNGAPPFPALGWKNDSSGWLAGLTGGHNWRRDKTVFGLEGEIGRLNLRGSTMQPGVDQWGDPYDASGTVDQGWYGGLSARLGYAMDRSLVFAKAGLVYSNAKLGVLDTCTVSPCGNTMLNASEKLGWGYQLGAGVEHFLSRHWTLKAEYAYMDFGSTTLNAQGIGGSFAGQLFHLPADLSAHTVKVGLNYKF